MVPLCVWKPSSIPNGRNFISSADPLWRCGAALQMGADDPAGFGFVATCIRQGAAGAADPAEGGFDQLDAE